MRTMDRRRFLESAAVLSTLARLAPRPAAAAGLREGDVIVRIGAMDIHNIYDLVHLLKTRKPGETVRIDVQRGAERLTLQATLGEPSGR